MFFHVLEDSYVTSATERTTTAPWGIDGGGEARPNDVVLRLGDGTRKRFGKATRLLVPKGATLELYTGGGGGYKAASERDPQAVLIDVREGYISEQHARRFYPHAFPGDSAS